MSDMTTNRVNQPDEKNNGNFTGASSIGSLAEKLHAISPDSGIIDPVCIVVRPGTQLSEVRDLIGFTLAESRPVLREDRKGTTYMGRFDTTGTNLLDAASKDFVRYIEGIINHQPRSPSVI